MGRRPKQDLWFGKLMNLIAGDGNEDIIQRLNRVLANPEQADKLLNRVLDHDTRVLQQQYGTRRAPRKKLRRGIGSY